MARWSGDSQCDLVVGGDGIMVQTPDGKVYKIKGWKQTELSELYLGEDPYSAVVEVTFARSMVRMTPDDSSRPSTVDGQAEEVSEAELPAPTRQLEPGG